MTIEDYVRGSVVDAEIERVLTPIQRQVFNEGNNLKAYQKGCELQTRMRAICNPLIWFNRGLIENKVYSLGLSNGTARLIQMQLFRS